MPLNLLQYTQYLKEYYEPAPLTSNKMVRLYRGDSGYIDTFDPNKFDPKSLFGKGTYLTSNRYVASTYTIKGGSDKVIATFYINGDVSGKNARLRFVIGYIMGKIIKPSCKLSITSKATPFEEELSEYYDSLTKWFLRPVPDTHDYHGNPYPQSEFDKFNDYIDKHHKTLKPKAQKLAKKYNKLLEEALVVFKKERKRYKFICTGGKDKDKTVKWEVIDHDVKEGHISEFDIPKEMIDNCYDAEESISPEILHLFESVQFQSYRDYCTANKRGGYKIGDFMDEYKWIREKHPEELATLGAIFYHCMARRWEEKHWDKFRTDMQKLGYTGIRYQGGKYTGSPTMHSAYVIWEHTKLIRVR